MTDGCSVLTYNLHGMPKYLAWRANLNFRKDKIASFLKVIVAKYNVDVLVVQELFTSSLHRAILRALRKDLPYSSGRMGLGYNNKWDSIRDDGKCGLRILDGGIVIYSKYPIREQHKLVFKSRRLLDSLAAKGAVLVRVEKNGQIYNIVGSHFQSEPDNKYAMVRNLQYLELTTWLKNMYQRINAGRVPTIVVGDFNSCIINEEGNFDTMVSKYNGGFPLGLTFKNKASDYTYDTRTNDYCAYQNPGADMGFVYDYIFISPVTRLLVPSHVIKDYLAKPMTMNRVPLSNVSDHLPVHAVLAVKNQEEEPTLY